MNSIDTIYYKDREIKILRLDILRPVVQGNKYYKLKYNIEQAKKNNAEYLLSFGGEYSNLIHALALAGKQNQFKTIGIIRGERPLKLSYTLQDAQANGMQIEFINRTAFRQIRQALNQNNNTIAQNILQENKIDFPQEKTYIVPEGGTNLLALKGSQEIVKELPSSFDKLFVAVGTAGTISGIIAGLQNKGEVIGIPSLKGNFFEKDIQKQLHWQNATHCTNWQLNHQYHFGGFAAYNTQLIEFMNWFYAQYKIPTGVTYTGKMFYAIFDMIDQNKILPKEKIVAIHTGGLQGIKGFNCRYPDLLNYF